MPKADNPAVRISYVRDAALGLDYGWCFDIREYGEVIAYIFEYFRRQLSLGFSEYTKSREWNGVGEHVHTTYGQVLSMLAEVERMKDIPGSLVDVVAKLTEDVHRGMTSCLEASKGLLVQSTGSYFGTHDDIVLSGTHFVEGYVLPGDKIRVTQWPGGKHYYASVGGQEVNYDGQSRWSSENSAREAAANWLSERKMNTR